MSLRSKLILSFVVILIVPCMILGWFSYETSKNKIEKTFIQSAEENVKSLDKMIDRFILPIQKDVEYLTGTLPRLASDIPSDLAAYESLHPELKSTFVGTSDGLFIVNPAEDLQRDFDPRQQPWYFKALANPGKTVITDPYMDATKGVMIVTLARATDDATRVVGVDLDLSKFTDDVLGTKIGERGYMSIIEDASKTYLVHPTQAGTVVPDQQFAQYFEAETNDFDLTQDGESMRSILATNKLTGWKMIGTLSREEIKDEVSGILMNTIYVILIALVVGAGVVYFIIRSILTPVRELTRVSERVSHGDLTVRIKETAAKDEIAALGRSFNRMIDSLRRVLSEVNETSHLLAASSEQLTASSEQTSKATHFIAENIQQMAEGADKQVDTVKRGTWTVNDVIRNVQEIASSAEEVSDKATQATQVSVEGHSTIETAVAQMNAIQSTVESLSAVVDSLSKQSIEIGEIVALIGEISAQTNLLALNASIEAARAGEHGRGFQVVALEVKKLAEQTASSSNLIIGKIQTIQSEAKHAVNSMSTTYSEVSGGIDIMNQAGSLFRSIHHSVVDLKNQIGDVSESAKRISDGAEQTKIAMDTIIQVVEGSAAATQNVSAAAQQQLASMEEIASSSEALSKTALELQEMNEKFRL